ncbi:MAG: SDR family oxidoreductase [Acidobacteriaceae bacterium]|nr:SDR family oxidoreductase [Acidobacteriaceae bacterium]
MDRLSGKIALVTAAAQGIGRATADTFLKEGAHVIAVDIALDKLKTLDGVDARRVDLLGASEIDALAASIDPIDVLFNAAGFVHHGTILDCSEEDWNYSFDLNVRSLHRVIRAFLPGMLQKRNGSIINVSSAASSIRGIANRYLYGTTKAAVIGLTKALAADFILQGVRVNAICPGTIESPSLEERIAKQASDTRQPFETVRQQFIDRQPMGRLGRPEEVAALAVYLASDESSFTTGQIHVIDGGFAL